jgi:hypothetical protein
VTTPDFEQLAADSFDHALSPDDDALLRVWGDKLDADGDPRGALIALEYAARAEPRRRREFGKLAIEHLVAHARDWLGDIGPLLDTPRALELDIRAGRLYGAFVDLRRIEAGTAVLDAFAAAPFARTLRRLRVRARDLQWSAARLDQLEELVMLRDVRPRQLQPQAGWRATERLRLFVHGQTIIPSHVAIEDVQRATVPHELAHRLAIGRALTSASPALRAEGYRAVHRAGPRAFMLLDTLLVLLEPSIVPEQAEVVGCVAALGARAAPAIDRLALITGRATHYDEATRRAAGAAVAGVRAAVSSARVGLES